MESRDLSTFPISKTARLKLLNSGFTVVEDLKGCKPSELSQETGLTPQEALQVLEVVFPPSGSHSLDLSKDAFSLLSEEKARVPISTSCSKLDGLLNGGIQPKMVTEVCGCPGAGKTQLCLQLCVNVQIPVFDKGSTREALYIDTEGSFVLERLLQITNAKVSQCNSTQGFNGELSVESILKGIHYQACKTYTELVAQVNLLPEFLETHKKVQLIIIDSIAFHFRYGFDGSYSLRSRLLNAIMQVLLKVANDHQVAVVLTNQMTTKIVEGGTSQLIPALGESWGHSCAIRLILSWTKDHRAAHLLKSPSMAEGTAFYNITKSGFCDVKEM